MDFFSNIEWNYWLFWVNRPRMEFNFDHISVYEHKLIIGQFPIKQWIIRFIKLCWCRCVCAFLSSLFVLAYFNLNQRSGDR